MLIKTLWKLRFPGWIFMAGQPSPRSALWNLSHLENVCPLKTRSHLSHSGMQVSLPDHNWASAKHACAGTLQWKAGETLAIWRMRSRTSFPQLEVVWERRRLRENRRGTGVDSTRGDEWVSREYRHTNNGSATLKSKPSPSNVPSLKCCLIGEPEGYSEKTA